MSELFLFFLNFYSDLVPWFYLLKWDFTGTTIKCQYIFIYYVTHHILFYFQKWSLWVALGDICRKLKAEFLEMLEAAIFFRGLPVSIASSILLTYSEICIFFLYCDSIHSVQETASGKATWSVGGLFRNCLWWSSFYS